MQTLKFISALGLASLVGAGWAAPKPQMLIVEIADRGEVVIELSEKAPLATAHIGALADKGFYNGQKIFRVVRSPRPFLAQMGDPLTKSRALTDDSIGSGGTGAAIPFEETGWKHTKGAVGLAMKADANGKLVGDSQFYFMLGNAGFLDGKYTVFGRITKGAELLEKLAEGDVITRVSLNRG
ncbi:MAG: peptidylprolyl isomerase [Chthonomonas sp.]|nr:peptidylprolyl isomerase [Chthonomonas sp.]